MIEDLEKLSKVFDTKIKPLVDAIEKADPTTDEYKKLVENYALTMTVSSNLNRTLIAVAQAAAQNKETNTKEEK